MAVKPPYLLFLKINPVLAEELTKFKDFYGFS